MLQIKKTEESKVGLLPPRVPCSNQLHLANWACFENKVLFLANSMIVACTFVRNKEASALTIR